MPDVSLGACRTREPASLPGMVIPILICTPASKRIMTCFTLCSRKAFHAAGNRLSGGRRTKSELLARL
jgi:hypothetical protein